MYLFLPKCNLVLFTYSLSLIFSFSQLETKMKFLSIHRILVCIPSFTSLNVSLTTPKLLAFCFRKLSILLRSYLELIELKEVVIKSLKLNGIVLNLL